jgi:hypothetical protein
MTGIVRPENTFPDGKVRPLDAFTAGDINYVGIRRRNGDITDGARRLFVEDGDPGAAKVGRFPDTAIVDADVKNIGLLGNTAATDRATTPVRADHPPVQVAEKGCVRRLGDGTPPDAGKKEKQKRSAQKAKQFFHVYLVISRQKLRHNDGLVETAHQLFWVGE